jgi:SAM-dependent methyltransferase
MPHLYVNDETWVPKAIEAAGWVTYHKHLGIYEVTADAVDLKIPYFPEEPWLRVARSFDVALAELNLTGNETILDLGAGRGWAAKQFALLGCRVVALDVVADSNVGLGRARALMDDVDTYFDRLIADGENLPFFVEKFDLVFCAAALHHSRHLEMLMQNIGRVLKPQGLLCAINEPCRDVLSDEGKMLARDAEPELELGIIETRPDLVAYDEALQAAGMGIVKAYPPVAREMDEATLRAWSGVLGAVRPSLRQRPFTHQLSGWAHYLVYQWRALRSPTKDRLHYFTPTTERQQLETAVLLWSGGELFLIANKVS